MHKKVFGISEPLLENKVFSSQSIRDELSKDDLWNNSAMVDVLC